MTGHPRLMFCALHRVRLATHDGRCPVCRAPMSPVAATAMPGVEGVPPYDPLAAEQAREAREQQPFNGQ